MKEQLRHSSYLFGHGLKLMKTDGKTSTFSYTSDQYNYEYWLGNKKIGSKYITVPHGTKPPTTQKVLKELRAETANNLSALMI